MNPLALAVLTFGGVVFASTLTWKLYQLYRAPWHLPTWAVTLTLGCGLLAYLFQSPAVHDAVGGSAGRGWAKLVENVLLMAGSCSLVLFFLFSATTRRSAVTRAWREVAVLGVAVILLVVCTGGTPVAERGESFSQANMRVLGVAGFYLCGGLYLVYALARALRWIISAAADAEPRLRRGLLLAAFGLAGMIVGSAARAALVVLRYLGSPPYAPVNAVASTLVALGILLFLTGVTYPGVCTRLAAFRLWRYRRRAYHELAPLWMALHDAFQQT
ncbi:MAG: MAB_1171c family putative transporter, partial [Sciscionella sp.]